MSNKKQSIVSQKDLNLLLRILKNNWWVPIVVVPIFYFVGYFYVYRLISTYQASTQILLQFNDAYYQSNVVTDVNFYGNQSYVDNSNEKRVLLSYDLINQVVNKLKNRLQVSYFIVGKVRTTEQFGGMPFNVTVNNINPGLYETTFDFKIIDENQYEISYGENESKTTKIGHFNKPLIDLNFNITIEKQNAFGITSINSLKEIYYQFVIHSDQYLISSIQSNISIENPDYTNILVVNLNDIIPERAVLVLDTLNNVYLYNKLKAKYDLNDKTVEYIDKQLDEISVSLKSSIDTLQDYKLKKSIINLSWEEQDFLKKISEYDGERSKLSLQLKSLEDLEKYIIEDKDPQFLPPTVFVAEKEGFMSKAVTDLYNKQLELNALYNVAKDDNPVVQLNKANIKKIKQDLLVYINNTRAATKTKIGNVEKEISDYIGQARSIPPKQQDLIGIQRKLNVNEEIYNFLLEKKANTRIAKASIIPDAKIIENPRNVGEVSPDRPGIKNSFISSGIVLSIIIIFLRAFFLSKIKTLEHLKELTEMPIVGVLPYVKESNEIGVVVDDQPNSKVSESFRNFRTNLQYANVGVNARTFMVTSFMPGEGKTFTSLNLAAVLAKSGKKTVILELDLHKPKVYKSIGITAPSIGLTTYISNQNSIDEIISESPIKNLYCMFAGPIPPNPSDLVLSDKLKTAIEYAKANFDYVIIDTPPAGLLSDAVYLIQFVDATIFVLNANSSTKRTINFVHELVETNNIKNFLLLLNGVRNLGKRYYYKGYGYSYGYGYGYGYGKGYGYKK